MTNSDKPSTATPKTKNDANNTEADAQTSADISAENIEQKPAEASEDALVSEIEKLPPEDFTIEPHVLTKPTRNRLKRWLNEVIFGYSTAAGRNFDIFLLLIIAGSVGAIIADSVQSVHLRWGDELHILEWVFTGFFALEYIARLYSAEDRKKYAMSFYGVIDLLAILPSILIFLVPGAEGILVVRILRMLRIFRIFKAFRFMSEASLLSRSLYAARRKVFVFLLAVISIIVIFGALMYAIEGAEHGFTSLPRSIYWAIVTVTTVGYGDIVPHTVLGQTIASLAMLTSYAIIAIPTGIVSAEIMTEIQKAKSNRHCAACDRSGHELDAKHCKHCGKIL